MGGNLDLGQINCTKFLSIEILNKTSLESILPMQNK